MRLTTLLLAGCMGYALFILSRHCSQLNDKERGWRGGGSVEIANSVHPDEVTHNEQPHPDLHCLLSSL